MLLTIRFEKISLKDAGQYIDLHVTVSVKTLNVINFIPVQNTPVALRKKDTYDYSMGNIELQSLLKT